MKILSVTAAARLLDVHRSTVYNALDDGRLDSEYDGSRHVVVINEKFERFATRQGKRTDLEDPPAPTT